MDNLNPEFLFPELSKQSHLFVRLTKALSMHLRPAPYPYGLLTLRLLGKLGGKNRKVLRDPIDVCDPSSVKEYIQSIGIDCTWALSETSTDEMQIDKAESDSGKTSFTLQIHLERCVEILRRASQCQKHEKEVKSSKSSDTEDDGSRSALLWKDSEKLWDSDFEKTDFFPFCINVIGETRENQVEAATTVLRSVLTRVVQLDKFDPKTIDINSEKSVNEEATDHVVERSFDMQASSSALRAYNKDLEMVGLGLMFGCAIKPVDKDALAYMKGLMTNMFMIVLSHKMHFVRVDANGSTLHHMDDMEDDGFVEEALGSLKPFGYFEQTGPLQHMTNPMTLNNSLAEFLSQSCPETINVGLDLLKHLLLLNEHLSADSSNTSKDGDRMESLDLNIGSVYFFENLLRVLVEKCVSCHWNRRDGLYFGICTLIESLGLTWGKKYESEIMYVAFFSLKSVPKEMSVGTLKAFQFFVRVCSGLYGRPNFDTTGTNSFVFDILSGTGASKSSEETDSSKASSLPSSPCNSVFQAVIMEMASTKQIVRIASRYVLKHYVVDAMPTESCLKLFQDSLPVIKRVLFSRSLRLLPLPEQIGVVEALTVIVQQVPELFPLNDQHLLAFLSELLKMASVADGEMTDSNLTGSVINKNGLAVTVQSKQASRKDPSLPRSGIPSSALFLRRDCILAVPGAKIVVPEELPVGVQLRVSAISLLRFVIRGHADPFFDAETSTPIGTSKFSMVQFFR